MRLGITEGCPTCVSIQTCVKCKCGGEATAPPTPSLFSHDLDKEARYMNETPSDVERDFLAPARSNPIVPETYEFDQEMEGLGDYGDLAIAGSVAAFGAAMVGLSLFLKNMPARDAARGVGIVVGGLGLASLISNWIAARS